MPFDGSGNFNRTFPAGGWAGDAAAKIKISATRHDTHDDDLAKGLTNTITKDGQSQPTANIPMNGKRIIDLGPPSADDDAATLGTVKNITGWPVSKTIAGADANGRLIFSGTGVVGLEFSVADIFWGARPSKNNESSNRVILNASAKPSTSSTSGDVLTIDERGHLNNNGEITNNLSWASNNSTWRVISPGFGSLLNYRNGDFTLQSNDVATPSFPYTAASLRQFFQANNSGGSSLVFLDKSASGKEVYIMARSGPIGAPKNRWLLRMGNADVESGTRKGSNFAIYNYANDGSTGVRSMFIDRETNNITFDGEVIAKNLTPTDAVMTMGPSSAGSAFAMQRPITSGSFSIYGGQSGATGAYITLYGEAHSSSGRDIVIGTESAFRWFFDYSANTHYFNVNAAVRVLTLVSGTAAVTGKLTATGNVEAGGIVVSASNFDSVSTTCVLSATSGGQIKLNPDGAGQLASQTTFDTSGNILICNGAVSAAGGIHAGKGLRAKAGSGSGAYDTDYFNFYWDGSNIIGYINTSARTITSTSCDYRIKKDIQPLGSVWDKVKALKPISYSQKAFDIFVNDDRPRLGFMAHELQETFGELAATGVKDGEQIQEPNLLGLIAGLTRALQEAMARIETLEAA